MNEHQIFYFCYSHNRPTGGQKHTYRHVDILNKYGIAASVFHDMDNFRLTWFENETRVLGISAFQKSFDATKDYVVLPEDLGMKILRFPGRKVIFNKNVFYGFKAFEFNTRIHYPYHSPDVIGVLAVSEHNASHLRFAYPHLAVQRVYLDINPDIFVHRPLNAKKPQIVCVRKGIESLAVLYHTIQSRSIRGLNRGSNFKWVFLDNVSEREIAQILQESILFVFTSQAEGLGRLPLEAMACGCVIAAFGSGPLKETIPASMQFEPGNIIEMAKFIESVMQSFPDDLSRWQEHVLLGRERANRFSIEQQELSVLAAWKNILADAKDSALAFEVYG